MTWPAAVTTKTVKWGIPFAIDDPDANVTVTATIETKIAMVGAQDDEWLVWDPTGQPAIPVGKRNAAVVDGYATLVLPVCDQSGWKFRGVPVDVTAGKVSHWYFVTLEFFVNGSKPPVKSKKVGPFVVLTADPAEIDGDELVTVNSSAGTPVSIVAEVATDAGVANLISSPSGPQTQAALKAAYVARGLTTAAVAAGALKRWNPELVAYNFTPANTRNLRAGLARARAGTGAVKIACAGDSTVAGYPANPQTASPPAVMRDFLAAAGYAAMGTGPVIANPGGAPGGYLDPRYTTTGTWTTQAGNANGILQSTQVGATITFTSDKPGTVIEFCVIGLGAGYSYSVDGGAAVAVTDASTSTLTRKTVTGLASATHSIKFTVDSVPAGGAFYLAWVDVRASSGVLVGNLGVNSTTTTDWLNTTFYYPQAVALNWDPDVTLIDLGINDQGGAMTTATFKSNLASLITTFKATGDVILLTSNHVDPGVTNQGAAARQAIDQAKYELADQHDVPLIDFGVLMDDYVTDNALGLHADQVHPNAAGYAMKGAALARALLLPG